ncbi:hypothetical protein SAMN02745216_05097 [Desulfatibacillum alkenivorans DSM 16219]|jgi:hypothetical protein|uniref:Dolichyl-phosphate-mannose-protein mannosyltransferase n=1 Tax=Desulfatibacillum alkenivorans DSM 16219 TaxID=1121393 RepID=A0A1M7A5N1_9BACT|nr:hypothetical protein [Desulfatibacillum alkenivorans]SHL37960.1 hypothetical protein SAMN02745216_05097 [Desulfatibacillum alkenivorans DSM 16219]
MEGVGKNRLITIFGLAAGAAGFAVVIAMTSGYGIGLTMDGASYAACARSLADGRGFYAFDGRPYIHWPPLFPMVLAAPGLFGLDPVDILPWLHALVFGLIVFGFHHILHKNLKSSLLTVWGTLAALLSLPLINLSTCAYSEPLFVLLCGAYVYFLQSFLSNQKTAGFALTCLFASMLCLQRYAGIALPVAGAAIIVFALADASFGKRIKMAAALCTAAYLPLGVWLARNFAVSDRFAGFKAGGGGRLADLLESHKQVVSSWIFPGQGNVALTLFLAVMGILSVILLWKKGKNGFNGVLQTNSLTTMAGVVGICFGVYWIFILCAAWLSYDVDNNPHRFIAVIQLPFYYLTLVLIDTALYAARGGGAFTVSRAVLAVFACFWVGAFWGRTTGELQTTAKTGPGMSLFNYEEPDNSRIPPGQKERRALCRWLDSLPEDCPVYSNVAPFLYGLYGKKAMWAPAKDGNGNKEIFVQGVLGWGRPCAFIRFDMLTSPDYEGLLTMQHVMDFPEGRAFLILPAPPELKLSELSR